mmetsp:Transcript_2595/g.3461  ORF Transcript_2595/g.3461 Transcript_2595/m.3461 type:complete len:456 (-) Transcript_2595:294-1661(-)
MKSTKRNKNKKSRTELLQARDNGTLPKATRSSPQDRPLNTNWFAKIAPTIVHFTVFWAIVTCAFKSAEKFGIIEPPLASTKRTPGENEGIALKKMTSSSAASIEKQQKDPQITVSRQKIESSTDGISKISSPHSNHKNYQSYKIPPLDESKDFQFTDYPNPFHITPKLREKFHPVVKFPLKRNNEKGKDEDIKKTKANNTKQYVYRLMDFTVTTGLSQLIPLSEQDEFRKSRSNDNNNILKNVFHFMKKDKEKNRDNNHIKENRKEENDKMILYAVGKYDENRRNLYSSDLFLDSKNDIDGYDGARTLHIGIDLGGPVGTKVYSFWNGVIHSLGYNEQLGDYGHVIVIHYSLPDLRDDNLSNVDITYTDAWALYGHLDAKSINKKKVGQKIKKGEMIGRIGDVHENGGWRMPHVHFQLSSIEPETHDMPGAVAMKDRSRALIDYPEPRFVLGPLY